MSPRVRWALLAAALCAGTVLALADAEARVGGGQRYGGGGGCGGGFSGGSGGGGGDGGLALYLLLRLVFEYPAIGIPLVVIVAVAVFFSQRHAGPTGFRVEGHPHGAPRRRAPSRARHRAAWEALREDDPGLSEPVLIDHAQRVVRRAHEAVGSDDWDALGGHVTRGVRDAMEGLDDGITAVRDVVLASIALAGVRRAGGYDTVDVDVVLAREETRPGGRVVYARCEERWTFRRQIGVRSPPPEDTTRLACPACGAAAATDATGRCTHCGTPVGAGERSWQASDLARGSRRTYTPPDLSPTAGGEEPGYRVPIAVDPDLAAQVRAWQGHHPGEPLEAVARRAGEVFLALQEAWDAARWLDARPHTTDAAWNTLRFWLEQDRHAGRRNRIADVRIEHVRVVRVARDAWYEAVTVHIAARARDWTEDLASGKVLAGSRDRPKAFAEYWTFLRAIGAEAHRVDARHCPSCGAPLDRVDFDGVCGYCETVITTGRFDWVLSRIDQPDAYVP